jgi:hypothetical protein
MAFPVQGAAVGRDRDDCAVNESRGRRQVFFVAALIGYYIKYCISAGVSRIICLRTAFRARDARVMLLLHSSIRLFGGDAAA